MSPRRDTTQFFSKEVTVLNVVQNRANGPFVRHLAPAQWPPDHGFASTLQRRVLYGPQHRSTPARVRMVQ